MPNQFLKPTVIANTAVDLLFRELVIARTVWTDAIAPAEFEGAFGDTVDMRVPARRVATTRVLRAGTPIVAEQSNEFSVPVKLDTDVYNAATITDEELTLDITSFGGQILMPQVRAVAEGVEDQIAAQITGATYQTPLTLDYNLAEFATGTDIDWYKLAVRARKLLNDRNVAKSGRWLLIGSNIEEQILLNDRFNKFDNIGSSAENALREAAIGRIAGFTVVPSNGIPADEAYAYHRTAFVLAARAPRVPQGASFAATRGLGSAEAQQMGAAASFGGVSVRWLMDYDYTNTTDRSLVNTWTGTAAVVDPITPTNPASLSQLERAIKFIDGPGV
jgi:hypothetical protein